ncbi:EF-P beta-lysylation protein EpmB [Thalassomonas sp. M1454]|uniref:EF-P beta-lysylation protein EpmB n=1 Tax=Thalassomonas sp. M1454 TaxID=2594477 RepID=UPI00117E928F|nr:EF-P beta-lysylation protein EpmB [Thalassomonas sp. M1454]TRX53154.1 EF-P beta-lysylation protein EpmB [Thalassomonas sp. M1454]
MSQIITQIEDDLHCSWQNSWQKELANVVTDPKELLSLLDIDSKTYEQHFNARKLFPVRVPKPFIAKMKQGDINDPLLAQVMPLNSEFEQTVGYSSDPLEEHETVAEGLLHKYKHRVLMIVKSGCAVNCRYCFRRHFPYEDNSPNKIRWQQALNYIAQHSEINEVIFSGGDPLMANDEHLAWLVAQLEQIPHLQRLRIHTRLPVVIPQRITKSLCDTLNNTRLKSVMVFHINHPNEIDDSFIQATELLKKAKIPLLNQSVLLRGINDDAQTLCLLSEKLFDNGIQPYYIHVLDKVLGAAHFDVSEDRAKQIAKQMMSTLPGFLMPKFVRENAGEANKTPLNLA